MATFKAPNFTERAELAKQAKLKALEKLKNKPALDPAVVEQRKKAEAAREAADAAKRQARKEDSLSKRLHAKPQRLRCKKKSPTSWPAMHAMPPAKSGKNKHKKRVQSMSCAPF
jgi:hypothetical protein